MNTKLLCACGHSAVYFSGGQWYCTKHFPIITDVDRQVQPPVSNADWEQSTNPLTILNLIKRVEQIEQKLTNWEAVD